MVLEGFSKSTLQKQLLTSNLVKPRLKIRKSRDFGLSRIKEEILLIIKNNLML